MLLSASRATNYLTKQALVGMAGRAAGSAVAGLASGGAKAAKRLGGAMWRNKAVTAGTAATVGFPAHQAHGAIQKGNVGMSPAWTNAAMQGRVKGLRPT